MSRQSNRNFPMLTQRIEEKFNYQTAQRLQETHVLELALAEIEGKCMWFSGCCSDEFPAITNNSDKQSTGGAKFKVYYDTDSQENRAKLMSSIAGDDPINLEADLINFVADLQGKVRDYLPERELLLQTSQMQCHEHVVHDGIHKYPQCIMQIPAAPISH